MGLLLLVFGLASAGDATVEIGEMVVDASAAETVLEAQAALGAGRFAEAAELYSALADAGGGAAARVAEAVSWYEQGEIHAARRAADEAVRLSPQDPVALNIQGLLRVDGGNVVGGIEALKASKAAARAAGRKLSEARAAVNLALAYADQGDSAAALAEADAASALAAAEGDRGIAEAARDATRAVAALAGTDANVGTLLGKGQTKSARVSAEARLAAAKTPRQELLANLDLAAVERAEGNLGQAATRLAASAKGARNRGLVREHAVALVDLGLVQSLGGLGGVAADTLRSGALAAQTGGYRVVEVDARCELGLVLAHQGDLAGAEVEQRTAGTLLVAMQYAQGAARQAELGGVIAAQRGDLKTATSVLRQAATYYAGRGRHLDAARARTVLAGAWQQVEPGTAASAAKEAEASFAAAGDALGPAHVQLARALGDARAKRLSEALGGFAKAASLGEAVGTGRGTALARVAREDAAAALVMLGHDADLAKLASQAGLSELVERHRSLQAASAAYDSGLDAYTATRFEEARLLFVKSQTTFAALGEDAYALRARRSAAWSAYNTLVTLPAATALPGWQALVEEAARVDDPELYARAYGAAVMTSVSQKVPALEARLKECTNLAERAALASVGARCHGGLAEGAGEMNDRAHHAKEAFRLDPDGTAGVYALYSVAVDAINSDDLALALELATLARPRAGKLAEALDQVIAAAKEG